jgi:hypothetical protein
MKSLLLLLLTAFTAGITADAQTTSGPKPVFTSVYTDLKKQCKALRETISTEGGDPVARCTGYGGYRISMYYSATSATLSVQRVADGEDVVELGTDYGNYGSRGEKIEWRIAEGKPFAVIMRLWKYRGEGADGTVYSGQRVGSTLIVKGLPGWERINAEIDGSLPDANARARAAADEGWSKR